MAKKKSVSSARAAPAKKNAKPMPDSEIDFSDIPEATDEELAGARRVGRPKSGRPVRRIVAIRIDPTLLVKLRKMARDQDMPYQSFIHELLEKAAKEVA